jgi:hypothetical protein
MYSRYLVIQSFLEVFFYTEVRGTCRKQFCLFWLILSRAVDLKVFCAQLPRRAFTGIRTHGSLVESPTSWPFGHEAPFLESLRAIHLLPFGKKNIYNVYILTASATQKAGCPPRCNETLPTPAAR